jgi:hypothetical protein
VHDEPAAQGRQGRFQAKNAPAPPSCSLP